MSKKVKFDEIPQLLQSSIPEKVSYNTFGLKVYADNIEASVYISVPDDGWYSDKIILLLKDTHPTYKMKDFFTKNYTMREDGILEIGDFTVAIYHR